MAQPPSRSILKIILTNFINSFRPRQIKGNYMGTDPFGNKFYEIPTNPSSARSRPSRWFEPPIKDDFQSEMSAEWESWLRFRRKVPPTEEEIAKNLAILQTTKERALTIDAKGGTPSTVSAGMESFPKRSEYEQVPGYKR